MPTHSHKQNVCVEHFTRLEERIYRRFVFRGSETVRMMQRDNSREREVGFTLISYGSFLRREKEREREARERDRETERQRERAQTVAPCNFM